MLLLDYPSFRVLFHSGFSPLGPLPTGSAGSASFPIPIPGTPQAAGISLAFQAAILDGFAAPGLAVTNGVLGTVN